MNLFFSKMIIFARLSFVLPRVPNSSMAEYLNCLLTTCFFFFNSVLASFASFLLDSASSFYSMQL